jgi:hypothetical protein
MAGCFARQFGSPIWKNTKFQSLEVGVDMLTPLQFTDKYIDAKPSYAAFGRLK